MSKIITNQEEIAELYKSGIGSCVIAKKFKISSNTVVKIARKFGVPIHNVGTSRKYTLDEKFFDGIDTEEKAYFLGLLYADGYIHEKKYIISLELAEKDKALILKFRKALGTNRPILKRESWHSIKGKLYFTKTWRLAISSKYMISALAKLGCYQNKSLTLKFPNSNQVPNKFRNHFIRGYFDGDGCWTLGRGWNINSAKQLTFGVCGTKEFLIDLQKIFIKELKLNKTKLGKRYKNNINSYDLRYGGNQTTKIIGQFIYKHATIYLLRKYWKYQSVVKKMLSSTEMHIFRSQLSRRNCIKRRKKLFQYDLNGILIKIWDSVYDMLQQNNYNNSCIYKCCKGDIKQAYGYIWKLK